MEEKLIEEEVARRVEELVAKRVEEELEKRKDEIEAEVLRRVEEAKRIMEKQMLQELEKQREAELEAQKLKEVLETSMISLGYFWCAVLVRFKHVAESNAKQTSKIKNLFSRYILLMIFFFCN